MVERSCTKERKTIGEKLLRQKSVKPLVKNSSDRFTVRIQSNINDGAPLRKQPTDVTSVRIPGADSTRGAVNGAGWVEGDGGKVCGLLLYRNGSSKLVYKNVVEVRSDYISYKKS